MSHPNMTSIQKKICNSYKAFYKGCIDFCMEKAVKYYENNGHSFHANHSNEYLEIHTYGIVFSGLSANIPPPTLYKFGDEFARELVDTPICRDITTFVPNKDFHAAFKFLGHWIMLKVVPAKGETPSGKKAEGMIYAVATDKNSEELFWFCFPFGAGFADLADILNKKHEEAIGNKLDTLRMNSMILNGLAYIFSGKPDLREYKAPTSADSVKMPRRERDRIIQECGNEDAILVSWDWKKEKVFHTNNWTRRGGWWWKPCGEGHKDRIWDWRNGCNVQRKGAPSGNRESEGLA